MADPERATAVQSFYGRWASVYDLLSRRTPGVGRIRRRAAERLDLTAGETVLEVGCGTGANLSYLRAGVGPDGRVVGVDLTPGVLDRARAAAVAPEGSGADLVLADGATPPIEPGSVDAVLATFVTGMFDEPADAVGDWLDLLAPRGRLVLVDLVPNDRRVARPLNLAFAAVTALSTPPTGKLRYERSLLGVLDERVDAARAPIQERLGAVEDTRGALGYVRVTSGRLPAR